ncbi:hypothetical protein DQ04_06301030 [Trypanosoma grayi]|uniref:hypothetical protein n=1 Tax=Trypanosoma grayi TaxID=71804 RepID=UPI0004F3FCC8|nr:hypothetical protein DQ04_06301030 [Trypanosoma grayi]KEG08859.1 hypothetical protein DQ04_06301030 [Trypanosoma grayi]
MALSAVDIAEAAAQQVSLLSFDTPGREGGSCCLFAPTATRCGVMAGGCITSVACRHDTVMVTLVPTLLRLLPLRLPPHDGFAWIPADSPLAEAVALLYGLPPVRLQAVSSDFPVFRSGGAPETVQRRLRQQMAHRHLERLRVHVPPHLSACVPFDYSRVAAWLVVSFPGADAVPDSCLFILPDMLVVRAAVPHVGRSFISPHDRDTVAAPGLREVCQRLQGLRLPCGPVCLLDAAEAPDTPPLLLKTAAQMM